MDRHKILYDQFMRAVACYEDAKEIEELSKKHLEINGELKNKANAALQKDKKGQIVTDEEQTEIDYLAKEQEKVYRQIADKLLKKYQLLIKDFVK